MFYIPSNKELSVSSLPCTAKFQSRLIFETANTSASIKSADSLHCLFLEMLIDSGFWIHENKLCHRPDVCNRLHRSEPSPMKKTSQLTKHICNLVILVADLVNLRTFQLVLGYIKWQQFLLGGRGRSKRTSSGSTTWTSSGSTFDQLWELKRIMPKGATNF